MKSIIKIGKLPKFKYLAVMFIAYILSIFSLLGIEIVPTCEICEYKYTMFGILLGEYGLELTNVGLNLFIFTPLVLGCIFYSIGKEVEKDDKKNKTEL